MPATNPSQESLARNIEYLSAPAQVRMANSWFDISDLDHFWVRRRFEVFQRLAGSLLTGARELAEMGCGHGLLQRQIEKAYGREVTGFDLNDYALKRNVSRDSKVFCYNIYQAEPQFRGRFDLIFLFDVLEHIPGDDGFFKALLFHLAPGGQVIVNVPAGQWLYSAYDVADGHVRRYSIRTLRKAAERAELSVTRWSYWGLPLLPAVVLRKLWLTGETDERKIIAAGFESRGKAVNELLMFLARCEIIPQRLAGTSLMAVLTRRA